jgi:methionine-rich copper-binding protein CopC
MRSGIIVFILLVTLGLMASTAVAHTSSESVPPGDEEAPGVLVRQIDLDEGDAVEWSWSSSASLDFDVTVADDPDPVVDRRGRTSQAGNFRADRAGTYVFVWSNDDPGRTVDLDLTVDVVQTDAFVLGILSLIIIAGVASAYGVVVWRRSLRSGEPSEPSMDDYLAGRTDPRHAKLERIAMYATLAALVAITVIALVATMNEGPTLA